MKKQEGMSSRTSNRSVSVVGTQSLAARRCVQEAFFRILQILLFTFGVSQIQPDLFQRYIDIPLYMAYLDRLTELQIESAYGLDTAKIFAGRTLLPRTAFLGQVNSSFVLVGSDSQDRPHGVSHDSMYPYTYLHYVQGNVGEYGGHPPPTPREVLLRQRHDQFGAVVETLRRRCEGRSPRETHRRWVCMRLGEIHLTEYDEPHQALKYFRIAAEVAGYHQIPEFMFHTALVYERLGNHELAVDTLANVMQQSVPVEGSDDAAEVSDALRGHRYLIRTCYASLHLLHLIDRNLSAIVGYDPTVLYRAFYHLRTYALNTELRRPCAKILMQGAWQLSASIHKQIYYALKDPHDRQWNTLYQQDPDHFVHAVYDHLIRLSRRYQYVEKEQMEALQKTLTNFIDRGVSETDSSEKEYSVVLSRLNLFDLIRYFRRLVCTVSLAESVPSSLCKQRSPVHMSTVQFQRWENAFHCPNLHEALFELHRVMNHAHVLEAFPSLHASGEDQTWLQRTHSLVNMLQAQCVSYYYQLARIYCIPLHSYELHSVTGSMIRVTHHIRNSEMVQKAAIHAQFTLSDECSIADGYSISHAYTHRSSDDTHFSAKNAEPVAMNNRMTTEVSASCASESEGVSSGSEHNDVMNQSTSPKIFRPDPSWLDEIEKRFERCHNKITKIGSLLELCDWAS